MSAPPPHGLIAPDWGRGVLADLYGAAFAAPDRELAGVLVGLADTDSPSIQGIVSATEGHQLGQAAMFGHDTWDRIRRVIDRRHPGTDVVGWYVSRPGYGTAPTPADLLNHDTWFPRDDQLLLILDSRTLRGSLFVGHGPGLQCLHEGPIERRHLQAPRPGLPWAGVALLLLCGSAVGAAAGVLAAAITS